MSMDFTIKENGGIVATGRVTVRGEDIIKINASIYSSAEKIAGIAYQLCDFTEVAEVALNSDDVRVLAEQDKFAARVNPNMVVALVADKDSLYGLSRMWQAYTDEALANTHVFRSVAEAEAWIRERLKAQGK